MKRAPSWTLACAAAAAAVSIAAAQTPSPPPAPAPPAPPAAAPAPAPSGPSILAGWSWPDHLRNAKVLPKDIGADRLRDTMRRFSVSLGVRCTFCHTGTEQMPFAQRDFSSDANPRKNVARAMMRMVDRLNQDLPKIAGRDARVTCFTCHRGAARPATDAPIPTQPPPPPPAPAH